MDFRTPRPADRGAVSRLRSTQRPAEEPQPVKEAPKAVHRAAAPDYSTKQKKSSKRFVVVAIVIIIVAILGAVGWFMRQGIQGAGTAIDSSKYQAVFFDNGQVYFGKLHAFNDEYMKLTDIYYLQTQASGDTDSKNPQETSSDQNNVQLIKLGNEIHGPQDEMIISKDQIVFYENLKPDGKVSQSIANFKKP